MNNLSQRERNLVIAILAILPIFILYFGWTKYQSMRKDRNAEILSSLSRKVELEDLAREAQREADRLDVYNSASLPISVIDNNQEYGLFIWNMAEAAGLQVSPGRTQMVQNEATIETVGGFGGTQNVNELVFQQVRINDMQVKGDLRQLTTFLFDFYDRAMLQRIDACVISLEKPDREDESVLEAKLTISGAVLLSAPEEKSLASYPRGKLGKSREEFESWVVRRNLFGPPNQVPKVSSRSSESMFVGEELSVRLSADDGNADDLLTFEMLESSLPEAKLEQTSPTSRSARLFAPEMTKAGRYKFKIRVFDSGMPESSDEQLLTVTVAEPKKEEPKREVPKLKYAPETYITSLLQDRTGEQVVILSIRPKGETLRIAVGESFDLDDEKWVVLKIDRRTIQIKRGESVLTFKIGSSLDDPADQADAVTQRDNF